MKAKMLKIAGVKSEKEFYKKYPSEEAFMKAHGKAFKKAQIGAYIGGEKGPGFQPVSYKDMYDQVDYAVTGSTDDMRNEQAYRQAELKASQDAAQGDGGGIGAALGKIGKVFETMGGEEGASDIASSIGSARRGKSINRAQFGEAIGTPINLQQPSNTNYAWTNFNTQAPPANPYAQQPQYRMQTQGTPVQQGEIMPIGGVEEKQGDWAKQIGKYAGPAGKIVEGIQQLKEEKRALERANQARDVSGLVKEAASSRPEETQRRYVRPEDITNTGEEFFPIYGVGTNVLARNGASVGGGEIMNTFAPNTLYDDLGYEPLNDSERYKQFMHGGRMHKAQDGFLADFSNAGGGDATSRLLTGITGENAGGSLGGTIGGVAGSFFGPAGKLIGQTAGQLIGTALDRKPQQIKKAKEATQRNIQATALQQGMQGGQAQYSSFMENGGTTSPYNWMSHTWQPQVIATFGEHKVKDLLRPPKDADMLRAGGHLKEYTPPSAAAMSTERPNFQMGGELQTHWGGYAETMSQNPYLPEGGETIMFRGQSHEESDGKGNTGIGITYGENPVEVERGEPAIKMKDGSGGDSSLVVFGNLKIPKLLGDPNAEGKNFKRYVEDLSKNENKQNKLVDKSITEIDELDVQTPFDRLKFNSLQANVMGGNLKLKDIAQKKMDAAALQSAMNDTIEQFGLKTTDKGNVMAKLGANILKAQGGKDIPKLEQKDYEYLQGLYDVAEKEKTGPTVLKFQKEFHRLAKPYAEKVISEEPITSYGKKMGYPVSDIRSNEDKIFGKRTVKYMSALKDAMKPKPPEKESGLPPITLTTKTDTTVPEKEKEKEQPIYPKRPGLINVINEVLPYLRPSDVEDLDPNQLAGEMYALATNQLEPVQAQTYQPQLSIPYDISLQDILNENEASFRSQQRMVGYNPAFQGQLGAQKYMANQKVLSEQFRMNQAMKNQVYKENRDILNTAQLQNLAIFDKQYERQAQAKSKTKATTQAALNSVAAKYAQNKLENRTLQAYENLYNYRFDPRFRATNMNPLVDFEAMIANASPSQIESYKKTLEAKSKKAGSDSAKNGSIVRSLKNI